MTQNVRTKNIFNPKKTTITNTKCRS